GWRAGMGLEATEVPEIAPEVTAEIASGVSTEVAPGVSAEVTARVPGPVAGVHRREQRVEDHQAAERPGGAGQGRLPQRLRIPPGGHRPALHLATGVVVRGVVARLRARLEGL